MKPQRSQKTQRVSVLERPTLKLLGPTRLSASSGVIEGLERKMAAMLAYLALEGPTPRQKLAGLLWPEVPETTARNNLRQLLHRLRRSAGDEVVVLDDPLRLTKDVQVDAQELLEHAKQGRAKEMLAFSGELLANLLYDDCLDMAEWVEVERERLRDLRVRALEVEVVRLEREGEYAAALQYAEALIEADPASEETYRSLMRLHHLRGDRTTALRAFERCKAALELHLGIEPLADTLVLAQQIEQGSTTPTASQRRIPLSILRPPVLAGREREWARLEAAWNSRMVAFVCGEPGVGKSRLVMDFATATGGEVTRLGGRPGDAGIPFSTITRHVRSYIRYVRLENFIQHNEPWVLQEISRLIPEVWHQPPPPITSDAEKLHLFEAMAQMMTHMRPSHVYVFDDLHYFDPASLELILFLNRRFAGQNTVVVPGMLVAFRKSELDPSTEQLIRQTAEAGMAALIELQPLSEAGVRQLLAGLENPTLESMAESLALYTGGNPLFMVETIKSLIESGAMEGGALPQGFEVPEKVGAIIGKRLERLSPEALKLARLAAVARTDFDLELAGKVLQTDALDLAIPYSEIESAQIWRDNWFTHDLIYETLRSSTPDALQKLLHVRTAKALEEQGGDPARIAEHWLASSEDSKAVPHLLEAAKAAHAGYRFVEAAEFYRQAAGILEAHHQTESAFSAYEAEAELRCHFDTGSEHLWVLDKLKALANTPVQRARAHLAQAQLLGELRQGSQAEVQAREGLAQLEQVGDAVLEARLLGSLGNALWQQQKFDQVEALIADLMDRYQKLGDEENLAMQWLRMGTVLDNRRKIHHAIEYYRRARAVFEQRGSKERLTRLLNNLAVSQNALGLRQQSRQTLEHTLSLLSTMQGVDHLKTNVHMLLGDALRDLNEYTLALHHLHTSLELSQGSSYWWILCLHKALAQSYRVLGQPQLALQQVEQALALPDSPKPFRAEIVLLQAQLGSQDQTLYRQAKQLASTWVEELSLWLAESVVLPAEQGLALAQKALETSRTYQLGGTEIVAATRCAQVLLGLGQSEAALDHSQAALERSQSYVPIDFYRGEVLWTHYQTLQANQHPEASQQLRALYDWLMDVADTKVPPEYRASFLEHNPVNRAILEAAKSSRADFR